MSGSSSGDSNRIGTGNSTTPFKQAFTRDGTKFRVAPPSTLTSRVQVRSRKERVDPIDLELDKIDCGEVQTGLVRVDWEFERREERA